MKILMAEVNLSEGTDLEKIHAIKIELMKNDDLALLDLNSDKDHNRSVFTYKGSPQAVLEGTKRLSKKAIELIDMTRHKGSHPRMGAVDVVPFIPVKNISLAEAVEVSKEYGKYLGSLGVPVYFYEDSASREDWKSLVSIRKGQYEALAEKFQDKNWMPDEGPFHFNQKSGATVTGARFPLIAFNVNLETESLETGKKIVRAVRSGFQNVRAIALEIPERNLIQVSMNLTHYEKTPLHRVYEGIKIEAQRHKIGIADTELVGPVPIGVLEELLKFYLKINDDFSADQIYS